MNHVDKKQRIYTKAPQKGFTLIELMLAMSFISVLLVTIAMTVIQIGIIYNRGLALKEVNQVARDIASDIRRTAGGAPGITPANDFVTNTAGGRMCFGNYSYIWNTTEALQSTDSSITSVRTRYQDETTKLAHFVKVPDVARIYCQKSGSNFATRDIRSVDRAGSQELLEAGEYNLALLRTDLPTPPSTATATYGSETQGLYNFSYTITAGDIGAIDTAKPGCRDPSVFGSNTTYCNVQDFTLVFRLGSGV